MPLTWRNVDTPNLSGSFEGLRLANNALTGAASGLSDALGKFGDYQQSQADNAVALAASKIQDPAALRAALADGSLLQGVDPSRISANTLANVNSQVGNLLSQKNSQLSLDKGTYDFDRTKTSDANVDAARPLTSQLLALSAQGKTNEANALLSSAEGQATFAKLSPAQQDALVRDMQGAQGTTTSNAQSAWNLGVSQRNDTENRAVSTALAQIQDQGLGDPTRSRQVLESFRSQMSPAAFAQLQSQTERAVPGTVANLDSLATQYQANGGLGGAGFDTVFANGKYGQPSAPVSTMPIGDVLNFGEKTLIPATKGKIGAGSDLGTSATGAYQMTAGTIRQYAPKVLGADYASQTFSPQAQDKLAEAAWNDRRAKGKMSDTFASLKGVPGADTAGGMANVSWDQIRNMVAQGESSTNPQQLQQGLMNTGNAQVTQQLTTAARKSENLANTVDPKRYAAATQNTGATSAEIGTQFAAEKGGAFEGTSPNWISSRIDEIRDKSNGTLSAAQAGEILRSSMKSGAEGMFSRFYQNHVGFSDKDAGTAKDQVIDWKKADALVDRAGRGEFVTDAVQDGILDQGTATVQQTQTLAATMQKRYLGMLAAAQQGRATVADVARAKAQFDQANAQYQLSVRAAGGNKEAAPADWQKNRQSKVTADNQAADLIARQTQAGNDFLRNPWLNTGL